MSRLVDLYPRAWRARYGEELEDLAAARPLGLGGAVDLVRGALDAHRHPELVDPSIAPPTGIEPVSRQRLADLRVARRLGIASRVGSVLWIFAAVVAANGPMVGSGDDAYRDGMAAAPLWFAALVTLSAGLIGQLIRLPKRAKIARFGAFVALVVAPLWGLGPWLFIFFAILVIGLDLLAIEAWWANEWSGLTSLAVVGSTVTASALFAWTLLANTRGPLGEALLMTFITLFTLNWLAVGASLQTLPPLDDGVPAGDDAIAATTPA
jgi:hypothetical protein